jgi:hypothetical protein
MRVSQFRHLGKKESRFADNPARVSPHHPVNSDSDIVERSSNAGTLV